MEPKPRTRFEIAVLVLVVILGVVSVAMHLHPVVADQRLPWVWIVPVFFTFCFCHACFVLGWRRAATLLGITTVVTFGAEYIGTTTGLLFGDYTYDPVVGYLLLGEVPYTIPMAWFTMLYSSYVVTNLCIDGKPVSEGWGGGRLVWLSFVGAMIMTAWDLTLDPYMVEFERGWTWHDGGPYFGIPYSNYTGWIGVSFVVFMLYRLAELKIPLVPLGRVTWWIILFPLLTYGQMSVSDIALGHPEETVLISPFAMGIPFLIALTRLAGFKRETAATGGVAPLVLLLMCSGLVLGGCPSGEADDDDSGGEADDDDDDDDDMTPDYFPPDQPGPYPAGTDDATAESREGLSLPVQVWFPAVEATEDLIVYDELIPGGAYDGAEPDCSRVHPVVVFSHGNSGIRYQTFSVMEFLATHGWIVVAPDHVDNTFLDFDQDLWPRIALRRPWDVADAFDWLLAESADTGSDLHGCVDPDAGYAVMGHSFGGFTTYAVAGAAYDMEALAATCDWDPVEGCDVVDQWFEDHPGETVDDRSDPRAWAAVPWAPAWHEYFADMGAITVPTLVVGADRDTLTPWATAVEPSYAALTAEPRYLAGLENAGHFSFTDFCDLLPASGNNGCEEDFRPPAEVLVTLRTLSLAFVQVQMGHTESSAWMPPEEGMSSWEGVE